jgi:MFS family permease
VNSRRNFIIITVTWALMNPFTSAVNVYFSLFVLELGGSIVDVGLINLASMITLSVSRLFGGYLADVLGRKRVIVPMTILYAFSNLIFVFAPDWRFLLIGNFICSLALMYQPALAALVGDILPSERRGSGVSLMNAPSQLLGLAGPPLATLVIFSHGLERGMRILFLLVFLSTLLSGMIRLLLVETYSSRTEMSFGHAIKEYRSALRFMRGDLGRLILISSSVIGVYNMAYPYLQVYAVKYLGLSLELWGLLSTLTAVISTISLLISGYLSDRIGRNLMMALGYLSACLGLILISLARDPLSFSIALIVNVIFASSPASQALLFDLTSEEIRGKINAINGLIEGSLSGTMSAIGGFIYGFSAPFLFSLASLLLIPLIIGSLKLPRGKIS